MLSFSNAFPTPDGDLFAPVAVTKTLNVNRAAGSGDNKEPLAAAKGGNALRLLTAIDPQTTSTAFSRFVLSALVFDPAQGRFQPHVNFQARIEDPTGKAVFASRSLHEYDGHLDVTLNAPVPGPYMFKVAAMTGDWTGTAEVPFVVSSATPAGAPALGGMVVKAEGLDGLKSGQPSKIRFTAASPLGTPASHSEIDFQVVRGAWGPPVLQNKIHTHGSAAFEIQVNFAEPGDYELVLDPVTIHGEVTPMYGYKTLDGKLVVPLKVAFGVPFPTVDPPEPAAPPVIQGQELPGFEVVALLGAALVLVRRRR